MSDPPRVPLHLLQEIKDGRVVLLIGTGVSTLAGLPSERDLAQRLAQALGRDYRHESVARLAQWYQNRLGRPAIIRFLRQQFAPALDLPNRTTCSSIRFLTCLPFKTIVTTNLDDVVESVFRGERADVDVIKADQLISTFEPNRTTLLKVHGDTSTDRMVITENDYRDYAKNFPTFLHLQRDLFQTHTMLFLGYDLGDLSFRELRSRIPLDVELFRQKSYVVVGSDCDPDSARQVERENVDLIRMSPEQFLHELHSEIRLGTSIAELDVINHAEKQAEERYPLSLVPPPPLLSFVGREKELIGLQAYWEKHPVILIDGPAGIGKTYLAAQWTQQLESAGIPVLWLPCRREATVQHVMQALSKTDKSLAAVASADVDTEIKASVLSWFLEARHYTLFLEDFQEVPQSDLIQLATTMATQDLEHGRLVLISRHRARRMLSQDLSIAELRLNGLPDSEAVTLLRHYGMTASADQLLQFVKKLSGWPLALQLLASLSQAYAADPEEILTEVAGAGGALETYAFDQILVDLDEEEQALLRTIAQFAEPFTHDEAVRVFARPSGPEKFRALQDRLIVIPSGDGRFTIYQLLCDHIRRHMTLDEALLIARRIEDYHRASSRRPASDRSERYKSWLKRQLDLGL